MPPELRSNTETAFLADQLERSFYGGAWHGLALAETLELVDASTASAEAGAGCHSLWQMVHHLRIWLEIACQRIEGDPRSGELAPGADWPEITDSSAAAWQATMVAFEEAHRRLHAKLRAMDDAELANPVSGSDATVRGLIFGILQHNAYHGGQIVCLKKVRRSGK